MTDGEKSNGTPDGEVPGGARGDDEGNPAAGTEADRVAGTEADRTDDERATAGDVTARYVETAHERVLAFERDGGRTAAVAQNREGYAMLKVRPAPDGDEVERYYGFEMALDHAAELLGVRPADLPVPEAAADMGM